MSRYIDADKLCEGLKHMAKYQEPYKQSTILGVVSTIENTPSADVVEVRHGRWAICGTFDDFLTCSVCNSNKYPFAYDFAFCPDCGAKMDGERKEENAKKG